MRRALAVLLALTPACASDNEGLLGPGGGDDGIPTGDGPLRGWLGDGGYADWLAEPEVHPGAGPHFGDVRTFFSPSLVSSLQDDEGPHPVGAASVKELYGSDSTPGGWAVMIKIEDGPGGGTWYWYERYDGSTLADAVGKSVCVSCHEAGSDHVLSPLP